MRADHIRLKRAYDPPAEADGRRILVDRLWPRGIARADAKIDDWMKELAPGTELRKWFGHDPGRWVEFQRRYRAEIAGQEEKLGALRQLAEQGPVTLVYGARDEEHNNAVVLRDVLLGRKAG